MTSQWVRWRLKSPASRLFTQPFIQTQIKENIKAARHWPSCGTGEFPAQMASNEENVSIWWRHHGILQSVNFGAICANISTLNKHLLKMIIGTESNLPVYLATVLLIFAREIMVYYGHKELICAKEPIWTKNINLMHGILCLSSVFEPLGTLLMTGITFNPSMEK